MRLINAHTLQTETFENDADRPPYAILSHRWADRQEVTLHELTSQLNRHKLGWQKIQFCCEEALKHGLEWTWVDTCCIDKTSSAELTEAINSMYRWYQSAHVCFAYISDASEASETSLGNSVWFKRSWTLQELLAPGNLRFYDATFEFMGTKHEKTAILSSITGVPETILREPARMYAMPVARRMSWAAARTATRIEDIAYSLFGIFDVNLPLLYGEGTRAFRRLQQEIIGQSDDLSIFLWNSPGHGYCPCFAASPADFGHRRPVYECGADFEMRDKRARPYALTNVGLRIDCEMVQYLYPIWLVFLPYSGQSGWGFRRSQYCFFLSQSRERSNVWRRVRMQDRTFCTLNEAIELACQHSFWPRETQDLSQLIGFYPLLGRAKFALSRAHWKEIYIELYPPFQTVSFQDMLHGMVLDMPSLFSSDDPSMRSFALVSNFDWDSPANPNPGSNPRYMAGLPKHHLERLEFDRKLDYERRFPPSRPLPTVPCGTFALYPLQSGPAGALFFEPPRLGLKALLLGFDQDFEPTAIIVAQNADIDVSEWYHWAFPFTRLGDFKDEVGRQQDSGLSSWLAEVLQQAFEGRSEREIPRHVHIEREERSIWDIDTSEAACNWVLKVLRLPAPSRAGGFLECRLEIRRR